MPKVNREHLFEFKTWWPPLPEQRRIAAQLNAFSAETQRLAGVYARQSAALAELKQALLHRAFAGAL